MAHGNIPDGMMVLHRCDNPPCVNPDHLFLGVAADNSADMVAKGRGNGPRGDSHCSSKLTENDVRQIRSLYASGEYSMRQLAKRFGVGSDQISRIVNRQKWAWLD
jgi:hypothetical protein